jgi:hypothetical protein
MDPRATRDPWIPMSQKHFCHKNIFVTKTFLSQKKVTKIFATTFSRPTKLQLKKLTLSSQKSFFTKQFLSQNHFCHKTIFVTQKILTQKEFCHKKNFVTKTFLSQKHFCHKKFSATTFSQPTKIQLKKHFNSSF